MYADFTWIIKNTNKNTAKRTPQVSLTICRPRGWPSRSQEQRAERWVGGGLRGTGQEETGGAGRWGRLPLLSEGALLSFSASPTHGFPQCAETAGLFKSVREREKGRDHVTFWNADSLLDFDPHWRAGSKMSCPKSEKVLPPWKGSRLQFTRTDPLILPRFALKFASLSNRIIGLSFWEKLSRCDSPWEGKTLKSSSGASFLEGRGWKEATGPRALSEFLPKHPAFPPGVSAWTPAAGRHRGAARWLGAPPAPGQRPDFSLWSLGPRECGGGQSRKQVCLLLSKAGFRGRETGSELARILPFISSSSPRISRQELPKSRVLISRGLGCRLPGFVGWSLTLLCSILPTGQVAAPAPQWPKAPRTVQASQWEMRCLYMKWPLIVSEELMSDQHVVSVTLQRLLHFKLFCVPFQHLNEVFSLSYIWCGSKKFGFLFLPFPHRLYCLIRSF